MSRLPRRGFTLLEAMVAVAISSATVVMAAKIAAVVIRQNNVGEQKTDLSLRSRILSEQLRADIRLAGLGSSGAIGVDPGAAVLGPMAIAATPSGGFPAIPAIAGANNVPPGAFAQIEPDSDALQLVVPNPITLIRTNARARRMSNTLTFDDTGPLGANCGMVYIHDHTNPNGSGRTQIAWVTNLGGTDLTIEGNLMFTAAPETEVMCARISTYWVDVNDWLHRTDLANPGNGVQLGTSRVFINDAPTQPDLMAPGVEGMQVAYKLSAEAFRLASTPQTPPTAPEAQWAFSGAPGDASGLMGPTNDHLWFEVRIVRVNLFLRHQKSVRSSPTTVEREGMEDTDDVEVLRSAGGDWMTTSEAVTNLRIFDSATAAEVPAEPY